MALLKNAFFLLVSSLVIFADINSQEHSSGAGIYTPWSRSHLGMAGFSGDPTLWYDITTSGYPDMVLLSQNRNSGFTQGKVQLTSTGLKINAPGNYSISFSASITCQNDEAEDIPLIPVYLVKNNNYSPANKNTIGSMASLQQPEAGLLVTNVHGSGIMNLQAGTTLSLVAANSGGSDVPLTVVAWNISAFKIP